MKPISQKLYEWEPVEARRREDAVRPGPPFEIAAETVRLLGIEAGEQMVERVGLAFHYGLAIGWAPSYWLLRRRTRLGPLAAGLASGAAMWLVADEGMTPALGFSAPNRTYPLATHNAGAARAPALWRHRRRGERGGLAAARPTDPLTGEGLLSTGQSILISTCIDTS